MTAVSGLRPRGPQAGLNPFVDPSRVLLLSAVLASSVLPGCGERGKAPTDTGIVLRPERVAQLDRHVWSAGAGDVDADGRVEVWLAGHDGRVGVVAYRPLSNGSWVAGQVLPQSADRHDCTLADFNGSGLQDFYCSTGADRGRGHNAAELWLQQAPGTFTPVGDAWGAAEPSARGRKVLSVDVDHDALPDLVTTAWPLREDADDSRTRVWRNTGGSFELLYAPDSRGFGARCLAPGDFDGDGDVDLLGCNAEDGLTLLVNERHGGFSELDFDLERDGFGRNRWWWSVVASPSGTGHLLAAVGGSPGALFVSVSMLDSRGHPDPRARFDCGALPADPGAVHEVFCEAALFADVNNDGQTDLWLIRRKGWRHERVDGDLADIILLGPDFGRYLVVAPASSGATYSVVALPDFFVSVTAGESWRGELRVIPRSGEQRSALAGRARSVDHGGVSDGD